MLKTMLKTFGLAISSGLVFGVIFALIGLFAAPTVGLVDEFLGSLPGAFVGFSIGYPVGPIIGLFLAKRFLHYQGSVLFGALSIIVVGAVVVGIVLVIELLTYGPSGSVFHVHGWPAAAILFFFLEPPLLGTLGFNLRFKARLKAIPSPPKRVTTGHFKFNWQFWKPQVSGILMFVAVVHFPFWFYGGGLWGWSKWLGPTFHMVTLPIQMAMLLSGFGGTDTQSMVLVSLWLLGVLAAIVGGIYTLKRKVWGLALVGSIGALLCSPFLGIPAIVLTALSKKEFKQS